MMGSSGKRVHHLHGFFHDTIIYDHPSSQTEVSDNSSVGRLEVALCEFGHQKFPLNFV